MKRDPFLYWIIGVLVGAVVVWFMAITAVNNNNTSMMRMMGMNQSQEMMGDDKDEVKEMHGMGMDSSMDDMMSSLEGKLGDDFDKAFLSSMIIHHQGAIEMAKEAEVNAKHDEVKSLAGDIISAQEKEIEMMKEWQKTWGY